jgi:membrane protein required for colicin V production
MNAAGLSGMIWVDYCILGLVALSALVGLVRGLFQELFSLGLWLGAGWVALHYNAVFAVYLEKAIPLESARMATAFVAIFVGVLILGGTASLLLGKLVSSAGLGGTDRLAGLLFGVARGGLIVAVLVVLAGATPVPQELWWKQSRLIPPFQSLALWLRGQVPAGLAAQVKFPEALVKR